MSRPRSKIPVPKWGRAPGLRVALGLLFAGAALSQPLNFTDACATGNESAVIAAGLANPGIALRQYAYFEKLPFVQTALERFALADPEEAVAVAAGGSTEADNLRDRLAQSSRIELQVLAQLAAGKTAAYPERRRAASLAFEIARGNLTVDAALRLAGKTPAYFSRLVDLRFAATSAGDEARALDSALELESLTLCRAVAESQARGLSDLSQFRARDLYMTLAYGQSEAADPVFSSVFDRLLLPKLRIEKSAMTKLLDGSHGVALRDFAAAALAAHRLDSFLALVGPDAAARLARAIDIAPDPVAEAVEMADLIAGSRNAAFLRQLNSIVPEEYGRVSAAGDRLARILYGLLAASLLAAPGASPDPPANLRDAATAYSHYLTASAVLDVTALFGPGKRCVQRYFFWDDDDGVSSFEHFKSGYQHDPAWKIDDRGIFLHLTGRGPDGRIIEIYANRPIDIRLPQNRGLEDESLRRQASMEEAMRAAGAVADVLVHRGHSFHVPKTLKFVTPDYRLVILGSCRGVPQIRAVMERSHAAQVIATRGKGQTEVNDALLKIINAALLTAGPSLDWRTFWTTHTASLAKSGIFRDYVAPSQDPASVFLRAYYECAAAN